MCVCVCVCRGLGIIALAKQYLMLTEVQEGAGNPWCFTVHDFADEEYAFCMEYGETCSKCSLVGTEVGESGTLHLLG